MSATGWQPIETAPKDGTEILIWFTGRPPRPEIAVYAAYGPRDPWPWARRLGQAGEFHRKNCTHWMPLPAAPDSDLGSQEHEMDSSKPENEKPSQICQCDACKDGVEHASDCAVHNAPAYPVGECDCGILNIVAPSTLG
jgi:hypothetical protein